MDEHEKNTEEIWKRVFTLKGVAAIVAVLVILYVIIYYIQEKHQEYISVFVNVVSYELVFVTFMGALAVVIIRCVQIVIRNIKEQSGNGTYFVSSIVLLLCSLFALRNFSYSTFDVLELLLDGQFFAVPVLFLIIVPTLMLCILSVENMLTRKKHEGLNNAVQKIESEVLSIASGLVLSLLKLVKFVTVDILTEIEDFLMEESGVEGQSLSEGTINEEAKRNAERESAGQQSGKEQEVENLRGGTGGIHGRPEAGEGLS